MPSGTRDACLLALALFLASCTQKPADVATAPAADHTAPAASASAPDEPAPDQPATAEPAPEAPTSEDPALDESAEDIPPATAPRLAGFSGFGPVPFGAAPEALQLAWGGALQGGPGESADACHYLLPQPPQAQGYGTRFMIEGNRFVRVDVDDADAIAPGGGRVGMTTAQIEALYPGQLEARPHKYVDGARYLRVTREGSEAVLLFETDAGGRVDAWRIGLPPQVDYVEGCG